MVPDNTATFARAAKLHAHNLRVTVIIFYDVAGLAEPTDLRIRITTGQITLLLCRSVYDKLILWMRYVTFSRSTSDTQR